MTTPFQLPLKVILCLSQWFSLGMSHQNQSFHNIILVCISINLQKFSRHVCLFRKCQLQGLRSRQNPCPECTFVIFHFKKSLKSYLGMRIFAARVTQQMVLYEQTLISFS
jgi:hypothetical protein